MAWIFRHKLLIVIFFTATLYWLKNPANEFGYSRKGCAVYNRIPVVFFDCYISPDGTLHLESDLSVNSSIIYWLENHLTLDDGKDGKTNTLLIGTGFKGEKAILFNNNQIQKLHQKQLKLEYYSSEEAVVKYNALRKQSKPCAILLKIK